MVRKTRRLYLVGQTRIHLDSVTNLGNFLELEVVLLPGQTEAEGVGIAEALLERLAVPRNDLLEGSSIDMLDSSARLL